MATPDGSPVAMVHCNNCTSDINAWAGVFGELAALAGQPLSTDALYTRLFFQSLHGEPDCGGVTVINYLSGEHVMGFERGCPLIVRNASARLTLPNLMRAQLYSALATLAIGMQYRLIFQNAAVALQRKAHRQQLHLAAHHAERFADGSRQHKDQGIYHNNQRHDRQQQHRSIHRQVILAGQATAPRKHFDFHSALTCPILLTTQFMLSISTTFTMELSISTAVDRLYWAFFRPILYT